VGGGRRRVMCNKMKGREFRGMGMVKAVSFTKVRVGLKLREKFLLFICPCYRINSYRKEMERGGRNYERIKSNTILILRN